KPVALVLGVPGELLHQEAVLLYGSCGGMLFMNIEEGIDRPLDQDAVPVGGGGCRCRGARCHGRVDRFIPVSRGLPSLCDRPSLLPVRLAGLSSAELPLQGSRRIDLTGAPLPLLGAFLKLSGARFFRVVAFAFLTMATVKVQGHRGVIVAPLIARYC